MPLDAAPLALAAYEEAYVDELFRYLLPGAMASQDNFIYARTRPTWQTQMRALVTASGALDLSLPAYERAYVLELYNWLLPEALLEFSRYILAHTPWYWQDEMRARIFTFNDASTVPEAISWFNQVAADGGIVSPTRQKLIAQFIRSEQATGVTPNTNWELTADYICLWGENQPQVLRTLKRRQLMTVVGSPAPIFTPSRYVTFDGVQNYYRTGLIPSVIGLPLTVSSQRIAAYVNNGQAHNTSGYAFGTASSSGSTLRIRTRTGSGQMSVALCASLVGMPMPAIPNAGYFSSQRIGTTQVFARNGASVGSAIPTNIDFALPTHEFYVGCFNNIGVPGSFSDQNIGFLNFGAPLPGTQGTSQYNNVQNFALLVGAAWGT